MGLTARFKCGDRRICDHGPVFVVLVAHEKVLCLDNLEFTVDVEISVRSLVGIICKDVDSSAIEEMEVVPVQISRWNVPIFYGEYLVTFHWVP